MRLLTLGEKLLAQERTQEAYEDYQKLLHEFPDYPDHGLGWVEVRAEENEPEALTSALRAGHFYATEGPKLLDVAIEHRVVVHQRHVVDVVEVAPQYDGPGQVTALHGARLMLDTVGAVFGRRAELG